MIKFGIRQSFNSIEQIEERYSALKALIEQIDDIVWEIAWEHNAVITAFIYEKSRFENDIFEPLFMNIQKEGVLVK